LKNFRGLPFKTLLFEKQSNAAKARPIGAWRTMLVSLCRIHDERGGGANDVP
jgi:hypothetical protein